MKPLLDFPRILFRNLTSTTTIPPSIAWPERTIVVIVVSQRQANTFLRFRIPSIFHVMIDCLLTLLNPVMIAKLSSIHDTCLFINICNLCPPHPHLCGCVFVSTFWLLVIILSSSYSSIRTGTHASTINYTLRHNRLPLYCFYCLFRIMVKVEEQGVWVHRQLQISDINFGIHFIFFYLQQQQLQSARQFSRASTLQKLILLSLLFCHSLVIDLPILFFFFFRSAKKWSKALHCSTPRHNG